MLAQLLRHWSVDQAGSCVLKVGGSPSDCEMICAQVGLLGLVKLGAQLCSVTLHAVLKFGFGGIRTTHLIRVTRLVWPDIEVVRLY